MGLFYTASDKEILAVRKKIMLDVGIPALIKQGFGRSPFSTAWYGYYPGNHLYIYELCRLREQNLLEFIEIAVIGRERWIQIHANVFRLHPAPDSLEALTGQDGMQFGLPPNSRSKMRLRLDDQKGPSICWMLFSREHKLGSYWTKSAFERRVESLTRLIEKDMNAIDGYFDRWHELHQPMEVDWTGRRRQLV